MVVGAGGSIRSRLDAHASMYAQLLFIAIIHVFPFMTGWGLTVPCAQVMKITGGVPLVCVMHKGRHAYVNRDACRACALGIVVTVPYMETSDYAHMCVSCSAKEITTSHIRSGQFV